MQTSLSDLIAAQQAYAKARNEALQAASGKGDAAAAARQQRAALLTYLQTRARQLEDARDRTTASFNAEIDQYQQQIGQVRALLQAPEPGPAQPPPGPAQDVQPAVRKSGDSNSTGR
jgi:hypothetical protein